MNSRLADYESATLPTELLRHLRTVRAIGPVCTCACGGCLRRSEKCLIWKLAVEVKRVVGRRWVVHAGQGREMAGIRLSSWRSPPGQLSLPVLSDSCLTCHAPAHGFACLSDCPHPPCPSSFLQRIAFSARVPSFPAPPGLLQCTHPLRQHPESPVAQGCWTIF